jgi:hypothetical protein
MTTDGLSHQPCRPNGWMEVRSSAEQASLIAFDDH